MKSSIMEARKFVNRHSDAHITFVGHSKGGAEAANNAIATNRDAIIFNPAPTNFDAYGLNSEEYTAQMTAHVVKNEILDSSVAFISDSIAEKIYLPSQHPFSPVAKDMGTRLKTACFEHSMDAVIQALFKESLSTKR